MMQLISLLAFASGVGIAFGGLLISKRTLPHHFVTLSITLFFTFSIYLGMLLGQWVGQLIGIPLISIIIGLFCVVFIVFCFLHYHPTLGFFHSEDKKIWISTFLLFLFMGLEYATADLSKWFVILFGFIFLLSVIGGARVQHRIYERLWRNPIPSFLPLVLLLFIAVMKLL
ncbi:hypothetical protein [Desertibacillus haloalkaliphilus]|uniref:hypothetical protein n=1 Tax=Desertibacillus haloalkaliphilus TaxID=1328930 RepID=UPI001C2731D3|nr:hypothetical protein [Desertibacillus haloalkaliphilus]MBU8905733.1 hypothetical protein [Desertibacillus haloalkaliphilus]